MPQAGGVGGRHLRPDGRGKGAPLLGGAVATTSAAATTAGSPHAGRRRRRRRCRRARRHCHGAHGGREVVHSSGPFNADAGGKQW